MEKEKQLMDVYFQSTPAYTPRQEVFDGKDYVVVPVVMMVQGVHRGSHGAILHPSEELGKFPASWDGIPVTLGHPNINGEYVSANSPEVLKDWAVGKIFNTHMDGDALKAEAWVEVEKLQTLSKETLDRINKGEIIEVSIGVFSDEEIMEGFYGVEQYSAIARNHRPNHLALLPDEVGACSIEDGCGLRVNKRMEVLLNIETNEGQSQKDAASDTESTGEAVQVTGEVSDPQVPNTNVEVNNNSKKEENTMSEKCTPCVKAKVNDLIANKATAFAETDREWLEALGEDQLEKMTPVPQANVEKKVTKEDVIQVMKGFSMEEHLSTMPTEIREQVQSGLRINAERRASMVTTIMANENNPWTKEELEKMNTEMLGKVFVTVNKKEVTNYSGFGVGYSPEAAQESNAPILLPIS